MAKPPVQQGEKQKIKKRQSKDNIPAAEEVLSRMVSPEGFKPLDDTGKAAVVKFFGNRQSAHNSLANIGGSIVDLAKVSSPDQFSFILSLTIHPLIQLKLPPKLCAPGKMHFEKERLTSEENFEEECLNIVLPHPKHCKLSKIPNKHPTHCLAAATHLLLQKRMFNTKVLQATIACKFWVEIKKLHLSMSGHKYDPGKKPSCKRAPSGDQDKTGKTADEPPKQKAAKKDNMEQPSQSDVHEIQEPEKTPPDTSKVDTDDELPYSNYDEDDSLPDPFPTSQQQEFETKNLTVIPWKTHNN